MRMLINLGNVLVVFVSFMRMFVWWGVMFRWFMVNLFVVNLFRKFLIYMIVMVIGVDEILFIVINVVVVLLNVKNW